MCIKWNNDIYWLLCPHHCARVSTVSPGLSYKNSNNVCILWLGSWDSDVLNNSLTQASKQQSCGVSSVPSRVPLLFRELAFLPAAPLLEDMDVTKYSGLLFGSLSPSDCSAAVDCWVFLRLCTSWCHAFRFVFSLLWQAFLFLPSPLLWLFF